MGSNKMGSNKMGQITVKSRVTSALFILSADNSSVSYHGMQKRHIARLQCSELLQQSITWVQYRYDTGRIPNLCCIAPPRSRRTAYADPLQHTPLAI
jgi:hypothetical protein